MPNKIKSEKQRRRGVTVTMTNDTVARLDDYVARVKGQNKLVKVDRQTVIEGLILDFLSKCDNL